MDHDSYDSLGRSLNSVIIYFLIVAIVSMYIFCVPPVKTAATSYVTISDSMPTKPFTSNNYKQTSLLIQNIQQDEKSQPVPIIKIPNALPYNTIRVEEMSKSISVTIDTTNLTSNNNFSVKIAPYNSCSNIYNTSVINCPFPPPPPLYHGNWSK